MSTPGIGDRLHLPTPEQARKLRPIRQKWDIPTRLDEKTADRAARDKAWEDCKRIVDDRDGFKCRCCGRRTKKTIELCPERAEHHHLATRRKFPELITDDRNVCLLCLRCHERVTRRVVHVMGTDRFTLHGRRFLNAKKPLTFVARERKVASA